MSLTDAPEEPRRGGSRSALQAVLPYTTVAMIIAALYVAWTFYSRHESAVKAQQEIQAKQEEARKEQAHEIFGSGEIKFSTFSLDTGRLHRGEKTELCYGVLNATCVKIDPPVGEETKPSYRHCVEVSPKTTTTYTITASDGKGNSKTESLTLRVE